MFPLCGDSMVHVSSVWGQYGACFLCVGTVRCMFPLCGDSTVHVFPVWRQYGAGFTEGHRLVPKNRK